jgi:hypothetical protein
MKHVTGNAGATGNAYAIASLKMIKPKRLMNHVTGNAGATGNASVIASLK